MFRKIKNAIEYIIMAYTALFALKGLADFVLETVDAGRFNLARRKNPDLNWYEFRHRM